MPRAQRRAGKDDAGVAASWLGTWAGNLAGCIVLAAIFVAGGGGLALGAKGQLLLTVAAAKMNAPALELFARAMLCNWLMCLAIWTAARMTNDTAKCIAIFWCLYAFIASGFEHSVANMTLFSIALLAEHPPTVTFGGMAWNLLWGCLGQHHQRRRDHGSRLLGRLAHAGNSRARGAIGRRRVGPLTDQPALPELAGAVL